MLSRFTWKNPLNSFRIRRRIPQIQEIHCAINQQLLNIDSNQTLEVIAGFTEAFKVARYDDGLELEKQWTKDNPSLTKLIQSLGRLAVEARDEGHLQRSNGIALYSIYLETKKYKGSGYAYKLHGQITETIRSLSTSFPESMDTTEGIPEQIRILREF